MPPKKKRVVYSTPRHSSSNVSQDPLSDTPPEWEEDLDDTTADPTVPPPKGAEAEPKQEPGEGVQTRAQAALAAEQLASAAVAQVTAGLPPTPVRITRATAAAGATSTASRGSRRGRPVRRAQPTYGAPRSVRQPPITRTGGITRFLQTSSTPAPAPQPPQAPPVQSSSRGKGKGKATRGRGRGRGRTTTAPATETQEAEDSDVAEDIVNYFSGLAKEKRTPLSKAEREARKSTKGAGKRKRQYPAPWMKEIQRYRMGRGLESYKEIISPRKFALLIRSLALGMGFPPTRIRWQDAALRAIHAAAEDYIIVLMEDGNIAAIHAGRQTLRPEDMALVRYFRREDTAQAGAWKLVPIEPPPGEQPSIEVFPQPLTGHQAMGYRPTYQLPRNFQPRRDAKFPIAGIDVHSWIPVAGASMKIQKGPKKGQLVDPRTSTASEAFTNVGGDLQRLLQLEREQRDDEVRKAAEEAAAKAQKAREERHARGEVTSEEPDEPEPETDQPSFVEAHSREMDVSATRLHRQRKVKRLATGAQLEARRQRRRRVQVHESSEDSSPEDQPSQESTKRFHTKIPPPRPQRRPTTRAQVAKKSTTPRKTSPAPQPETSQPSQDPLDPTVEDVLSSPGSQDDVVKRPAYTSPPPAQVESEIESEAKQSSSAQPEAKEEETVNIAQLEADPAVKRQQARLFRETQGLPPLEESSEAEAFPVPQMAASSSFAVFDEGPQAVPYDTFLRDLCQDLEAQRSRILSDEASQQTPSTSAVIETALDLESEVQAPPGPDPTPDTTEVSAPVAASTTQVDTSTMTEAQLLQHRVAEAQAEAEREGLRRGFPGAVDTSLLPRHEEEDSDAESVFNIPRHSRSHILSSDSEPTTEPEPIFKQDEVTMEEALKLHISVTEEGEEDKSSSSN